LVVIANQHVAVNTFSGLVQTKLRLPVIIFTKCKSWEEEISFLK
jgi:hypothetical protein